VTGSPTPRHQLISGNLAAPMWAYLQQTSRGRVYMARLAVILSHYDVVEPDLIYVSAERRAQIEASDWIRGAPDLLVEITLPETQSRDETIKRSLYERFAVSEYWIVDLARNAVTVDRLVGSRYERAAEFTQAAGDALTTPLLPGFELPLVTVFDA
jgi:Uma2 family endonuclease